MNVELIGEKQYLDGIISTKKVWVLMQGESVYSKESSDGIAIVTWVSQEEALEYRKRAELYETDAVFAPLDHFIEHWLLNDDMNIAEVMAFPKFGFPVLTFTKEEYVQAFKA